MRILLFILLSLSAFGQIDKRKVGAILMQQSGGSAPLTYTPFPAIPVKSNGTLLTSGMGSAITQGELGAGKTMAYVPDVWSNLLRAQSLDNVIFRPNRTDSLYAVLDGSALGSISAMIGQTGSPVSTNVSFYKLVLEFNQALSSAHGVRWTGGTPGTNLYVQDVVIKYPKSPGIQINDFASYGDLSMSFIRIFGVSGEAPTSFIEGSYKGRTNPAEIGLIDRIHDEHWFITGTAGDAYQVNCVEDFRMHHFTITDVAYNAVSGQRAGIQAQNLGDGAAIDSTIVDGASRAFVISGRNVTINDVIFYSDDEGQYQDLVASGYTSPLSTVGGTITLNRCEFYSRSGARSYGFTFAENFANLVLNDCKRGAEITQIVGDIRTDTVTYSITENNTTIGTYEEPIYISLDPDDRTTHGLITNTSYRTRKIGFRNK